MLVFSPMGEYLNPDGSKGVMHHMEAYLTPQQAEMVIEAAKKAQLAADNSSDHDWLHSIKGNLNFPVLITTPDYDFQFPWSYICLFLCGLAWSALTHRLRFVPRYPDPEDAENANDSWENIADQPAIDTTNLSIAEQLAAKEAFDDPNSSHQHREPIHRFPIKNPSEHQIETGLHMREQRDTKRKAARVFLGMLIAFVILTDMGALLRVADIKDKVERGEIHAPRVILVIDFGTLPEGETAHAPVTIEGKEGEALTHVPQRKLPFTREWKPEFPLPMSTFIFLFGLIHLALPPLSTPRVRLLVYDDKIVAIPITYPLQYFTLNFSDVTGIDVKGEETPSGTMYFRHRRYVQQPREVSESFPQKSHYKTLRGYLYSGLGDLGVMTIEDSFLVILRTREGVQPWGVQVQGMGIERLRDLLDDVISKWRALEMTKDTV
ncbi:hypothetical protein HDU76_002088 [Blyttiomyces sp. JEL0837]|nr:hypothetical protein HDU76_002088 [Blyttiomyces sp. JEL0837]